MTGMRRQAESTMIAARGPRRRGVTLIEMLVAMSISLIMMAAVANLFAVVGSSVSASRASITMSEQARSARNRLQADLAGITAPTLPPLRPEDGAGYLEYIEGFNSEDSSAFLNGATVASATSTYYFSPQNINSLMGDVDDVLMFTTRSKDGQPFIGKFCTNIGAGATPPTYLSIESQMAEVAYFTIQNGRSVPMPGNSAPQPLYTLYRRVLLVAPEYNGSTAIVSNANTPLNFFNEYDVSAHYDTTNGVMVLNSLSDLTKRENRFAHDPVSANYLYPVFLPPPAGYFASQPSIRISGTSTPLPFPALAPLAGASRVGDDVLLTNVLAFDVKVYDPQAPVLMATYFNAPSSAGATAQPPGGTPTPNPAIVLVPSDLDYWTSYNTWAGATAGASQNQWVAGYGAFVDLGYGVTGNPSTLGPTTSAFFHQPHYYPFYPSNAAIQGHMPANATTAANAVQLVQWSALQGYPVPNGSPQPYGYTYDTWSRHYESPGPWNGTPWNYSSIGINGLDDPIDQTGSNQGIYDSSHGQYVNGADDPGELQYPPPYPTPLRGIQIKIRTYEPDSKQIREVTIVQDFVPQ